MIANNRICIFTCAHDTTDARVVEREAVSLQEAGYNVTYYTPFEGESPVTVISYGNATAEEYPEMGDRVRWAGRLARRLFDSEYDVYHFHGPETLPVGVLLGAITNGNTVYDVHEDIEAVLRHKPIFPEPVRPFLAKAAGIVERTLARFVDGIVVASPDIAGRFGVLVDHRDPSD